MANNNDRDTAREAAKLQCDHEWNTAWLIPRCEKCNMTELTFVAMNRGIERGFDAGYASRDGEVELLRKEVAAANKGAKTNALVNEGLVKRIAELQAALSDAVKAWNTRAALNDKGETDTSKRSSAYNCQCSACKTRRAGIVIENA